MLPPLETEAIMSDEATCRCPKCNSIQPRAAKLCRACGTDLAAAQSVRACLERGEGALLTGKFADAKDEFQQALTLDANCEQARQGLVKAAAQMATLRVRHLWAKALEEETRKDFKAAEALYREIVSLDPNDTKAAEALKFVAVRECVERGEASFKAGRYADAREEFQRALALDGGSEQARQGLAKADEQIRSLRLRHLASKAGEAEAKKEFAAAEALYREILTLDPANEKARSATEALGLAVGEQVKACLNRAEAAFLAGKFADARDDFQQALTLDASCEQAREGLVKAAREIKALRLRHLWNQAGEAEAQGDFKAAADRYREIGGLDPDDTNAPAALRRAIEELVRPCVERGEAALRAGEFATARDAFRQALSFDPNCEQARKGASKAEERIREVRLRHLWNTAWQAETHEDLVSAETMYREITTLDPNDTKAQSAVAAFGLLRETTRALRRTDFKDARRLAREIVRNGPPDGKAVEKAKMLLGVWWDYVCWFLIGLACGTLMVWRSQVMGWDTQLVANEHLALLVRIAAGVVVAVAVFLLGYTRARTARIVGLGLFKQYP